MNACVVRIEIIDQPRNIKLDQVNRQNRIQVFEHDLLFQRNITNTGRTSKLLLQRCIGYLKFGCICETN